MLDNHAKLVKVIAASEGIVGRKKLQKIIYIMKKLGLPFEEKYTFYFYGPYSEELSLRIEELTNLGFVSEVKEKKSNYYQYRYQVTEQGEDFLKHSNTELPPEISIAKQMKEQSSRFLELVSTMLYFDHLPKQEIEQKVQEVKAKSNYTSEDIEQAWDYINSIKK
ncbi:YwgA family protein [Gracilibacillus caseinilyticus]|uniref:YwgA family protein n=1 Tax=Gracilibacillus caseinilyticus TaxID=2932256 RepID=A0ABY4F221_9BACI|nr:YwgA family protein [Gracilibacillus caseinilyticus]UOQ50217.1 YwgA family protein [Gracilibacillus caseinilyticus]